MNFVMNTISSFNPWMSMSVFGLTAAFSAVNYYFFMVVKVSCNYFQKLLIENINYSKIGAI